MGRSSPLKGAQPVFRSCLLWSNGWMEEDATWYGSRPRPKPHCTRRGPSSLAKCHSSPTPSFRPMSIVAAVAHLSYCWALVNDSLTTWAYETCKRQITKFRAIWTVLIIRTTHSFVQSKIFHVIFTKFLKLSNYTLSHWITSAFVQVLYATDRRISCLSQIRTILWYSSI